MTADWLLHGSDRWLVPLGGGIGRVFKLGDQPINARVQLFNNVVKPTGAGKLDAADPSAVAVPTT